MDSRISRFCNAHSRSLTKPKPWNDTALVTYQVDYSLKLIGWCRSESVKEVKNGPVSRS